MRKPFNIIPLIAYWRERFERSIPFHMEKARMKEWIKREALHLVDEKDVDLATDCLIAAGFGYEGEQEGTVVGGYVYISDA
jgi:hypothetical protein